MTMEEELRARIASLVEKHSVLDKHCNSYKKELKKLIVDYEFKLDKLDTEVGRLQGIITVLKQVPAVEKEVGHHTLDMLRLRVLKNKKQLEEEQEKESSEFGKKLYGSALRAVNGFIVVIDNMKKEMNE